MNFTVATFNLRNLALPNVNIYRDLSYSKIEYAEKMKWSAAQLKKLNADVVAFQESFHDDALFELASKAGYKDWNLFISDTEELEPKVALLSRLPIKSQRSISLLPTELQTEDFKRFRRPLIHAEVELTEDLSVHIFAIHLKSKQPLLCVDENPLCSLSMSKGIAKSLHLRAIEATAIRSLILKALPAPVIVLGDFNDVSQAVTTQIICGPTPPYQSNSAQRLQFKKELLFPVCEATALERYSSASYTYLYNGWHENIDHILLSHHFSKNNPEAIGQLQYSHVYNDHLIDHGFYGIDMPKYISDHGQLVANLEVFKTLKH